jgi:hypothetical protein
MPELLDIQQDLSVSLRDATLTTRAQRWLAGDAAQIEQRLAIYRANVAASATKALSATYPVIRQVVGEDFFDGLARAYLRAVPSQSGDLHDYGAAFSAFVAGFAHTQSLPYLPDLARLEWAVHRAYGAEDVEPWNQAALAQVAPAQQAAICLEWAAGTALVDSNFPIARIWLIHQPAFEGDFSVDWSVRECALVARDGLRAVVSALAAGDAAFIAGSLAGAPLGICVEQAVAAEPAFDLGRLLARAMATNAICGFSMHRDD